MLGAAALVAVLAFGATANAQNKCSSGKAKLAGKKIAAILGCYSKASGKGIDVDASAVGCVTKAQGKFSAGSIKIDGKQDPAPGKEATVCPQGGSDDVMLENWLDDVSDAIAQAHDPGLPHAPKLSKCTSGKVKCAGKKAAAILGCYAKALGKGLYTDVEVHAPGCLAKADGKFVACYDKLELKEIPPKADNSNVCVKPDGDKVAIEAAVDARALDVVRYYSATAATCPSRVTFVGTSTAGVLDAGWTGQSHDSKTITDGMVTTTVSGCAADAPLCGVCNYSGPIANVGANEMDTQRCSCDSSVPCTVNTDCPGSCACVFYFGSYLPLSAGGISTCVSNTFNGSVVGTFNAATGATAGGALLTSKVYSGPTADNPCPKCVGDTTLNDGAKGGHCLGGARDTLTCDAMGTSPIKHFGSTSLDCPPAALGLLATLPIDLSNTTGTKTKTLGAGSPNCRATGFTTQKCFCDTCNNAAATPCSSDADCTAVGATICGGKRCTGGANNGAACTVNSQCPGSSCGVPGLPTAPNQCADGVCSPTTGNEGECSGGPFEQFCGPSAEFQFCTTDANCTAFNICVGGTNPGTLGCPGTPCTGGGTCEVQTCGNPFGPANFRRCYLDNGAIGGTINATGQADAPVGHASDPSLAAIFCIGPTGPAVDAVAGLPGPGRLELPGHATDNGTP
jgi:hypothetical protein